MIMKIHRSHLRGRCKSLNTAALANDTADKRYNIICLSAGLILFYGFKQIFSHSADRTYPVIGNIFKFSSRSDSAVRVTYCRIIDPVADCTYIFFHTFTCL